MNRWRLSSKRFVGPQDPRTVLAAEPASQEDCLYSRLHIRKEQLIEASLYVLAWSFVFWDMLRYVLTAPAEKETPGRIRLDDLGIIDPAN
jgi:hypothetical protein